MWSQCVNKVKNMRVFETCTAPQTTLCSFWNNISGHFVRFACNHSNGYAFRRIVQTDSLIFPQNSALL